MRCLIYASNEETTWLNEYFPDVEPYLLKIANKPLLEYSLDVISLLGINELRIVSDNSLKKIEQHLGNGEQWGIDISYSLSHPGIACRMFFGRTIHFAKNTIFSSGMVFSF